MDYVTAAIILVIFVPALIKKVPVYDSLRKGAADGFDVIVKILPAMICIMSATAMLRASGAMEWLVGLISPLTDFLGIPSGVVPMALLRPVSGSGAMGLLADNISVFGADSLEGVISSVIMGSTETTFYTLAVYFGATGVKNIKIPLICGLIGDIAAVIIAVIVAKNFVFC